MNSKIEAIIEDFMTWKSNPVWAHQDYDYRIKLRQLLEQLTTTATTTNT